MAADPSVTTSRAVDGVCDRLFLSVRARDSDDNLVYVRDRMLGGSPDRAALLDLYARVLRRDRVRSEDNNPLIDVLALSGVTREVDKRLWVRNHVYDVVFDRKWVRASMPDAEKRRQRAAYRRGLWRASGLAAVVVAGVGALAGYAMQKKEQLAEVNAMLGVQNRQTQEAYDQLKDARRRSRESAVTGAVATVGALDEVPNLAGLSVATERLVEQASKPLDVLVPIIPVDEPDLLRRLAAGYDAVARFQLDLKAVELDRGDLALANFEKARGLRAAIARRAGAPESDRLDLAASHEQIGRAHAVAGRFDAARALFGEAMKILSAFPPASPSAGDGAGGGLVRDRRRCRPHRPTGRGARVLHERDRGAPATSGRECERRGGGAESPAGRPSRGSAGDGGRRPSAGRAAHERGAAGGSGVAFPRRARRVLQGALSGPVTEPESSRLRLALANATARAGEAREAAADFDAALADYTTALQLAEAADGANHDATPGATQPATRPATQPTSRDAMSAGKPSIPAGLEVVADLSRIGGVYAATGDPGAALDYFTRAVERADRLKAVAPLNFAVNASLAAACDGAAAARVELGKRQLAMTDWRRARDLRSVLVELNPGGRAARRDLR